MVQSDLNVLGAIESNRIVLGAIGLDIVLEAILRKMIPRSFQCCNTFLLLRYVAPEMEISLQKEVQITSALIQCDPMGREEPIDLS